MTAAKRLNWVEMVLLIGNLVVEPTITVELYGHRFASLINSLKVTIWVVTQKFH